MIITISGFHGSGKTTVGKKIAEKLGYKFMSTGDIRGEVALKHNMTMNELNKVGETEAWAHREVDDKWEEIGKTQDNLIMDSWIAFHFIPHSLKIFFKVDPMIGAERVFKHKQSNPKARKDETKTTSVEQTAKDIQEKMDSWEKGIEKHYGVMPFDPHNFDFVIDTSHLDIDEVTDRTMEIIEKEKEKRTTP